MHRSEINIHQAWHYIFKWLSPNSSSPGEKTKMDAFSICPHWYKDGCSLIYSQLRARRALLLYRVYGDSALLVLKGITLNSVNALLILRWLYSTLSIRSSIYTTLYQYHREGYHAYYWLSHLNVYGNERVNPHSTRPCKPYWLTTHLHAFGNERVNPHSTRPCKPHWLTTHLHAYGNERVNPHSTKPCKP